VHNILGCHHGGTDNIRGLASALAAASKNAYIYSNVRVNWMKPQKLSRQFSGFRDLELIREIPFMMEFRILLVLVLCIVHSSCKKEVVDVDVNYEGEWHSEPIISDSGLLLEKYFIIEDGQGIYGEFCELDPLGSNCSFFFNGEVKFNFSEKKLFIGPWNNQSVFTIEVDPHLNSDDIWECTVSNTIFTRI
jgi:hypothetical protein